MLKLNVLSSAKSAEFHSIAANYRDYTNSSTYTYKTNPLAKYKTIKKLN